MATTMGVLFFLMPWAGLIVLGAAAIPFFLTRSNMLAGLIIFTPMPLLGLWLYGWDPAVYSALLPCVVGFTHFLTTRNLPPELKEQAGYMRRKS
jgi:glycerol-3-phosphate acyltransferase PlsY